jgi:GntR family transcriptional regulator/MocR family aminotransferase
MIVYDLKTDPKEPLYMTLYRKIRQDIIQKHYQADEKMPGKRTMANAHGISVNTVTSAYELLKAEGFLYSIEKKGYFVSRIHYVEPRRKRPVVKAVETKEHWFMDFRADRASLHLFPSAVWSRCMREAVSISDGSLYESVTWKGMAVLRNAIAKDLSDHRGMGNISPEQIIIGSGTEYLYGRLMEILGREITIASADNGRSRFEVIAEHHGNHWVYLPTDEKNMRADLLKGTSVSAVQLSPANLYPTGRAMPVDRRIEFFEWANEKTGRWIIEDDYDSEFRFGPSGRRTMFSEDASDKVIYLNTFSKTMVPTIRISYMVLPPILLKRYEGTASFNACTASSFEQYALAQFIEKGHYERHVYRLIAHYSRLREAIRKEIHSDSFLKANCTIVDAHAGTHFLLQIHTECREEDIRKRAVENGLRFTFYHPVHEKKEKGQMRIIINCASINEADLQEAVQRLSHIFSCR